MDLPSIYHRYSPRLDGCVSGNGVGAAGVEEYSITFQNVGQVSSAVNKEVTGVPRSLKTAPPQHPTVGLCLGPYGDLFLMSEVTLYRGGGFGASHKAHYKMEFIHIHSLTHT